MIRCTSQSLQLFVFHSGKEKRHDNRKHNNVTIILTLWMIEESRNFEIVCGMIVGKCRTDNKVKRKWAFIGTTLISPSFAIISDIVK